MAGRVRDSDADGARASRGWGWLKLRVSGRARARRVGPAGDSCGRFVRRVVGPPLRLDPGSAECFEDQRQRSRSGAPAVAGAVVVGVVEEDHVTRCDSGCSAVCNRRWRRAWLPVAAPLRPEQRLEPEALDHPEPRQAEDAVRWPVQAGRQPRRGPDGVDRTPRVVTQQAAAPVAARLMAVTVQSQLVPGCDDVPHDLRDSAPPARRRRRRPPVPWRVRARRARRRFPSA